MTLRTRVCVYGVRSVEDARAAAAGGADAVGLVFAPGSACSVHPERAWEIAQSLPPFISTVGVFSNASVEQFSEIEEVCPTDYSQLHGDEPEEVVRQCGPRVIKTVRANPQTLERELARWGAVDEVDAVMVRFGADSGISWEEVRRATEKLAKPLLIGGGLTMHNVGEVVRTGAPWGIGVGEAVQSEMGEDDGVRGVWHHLVNHIVSAARKADKQMQDRSPPGPVAPG